ncbi:serglycin [Alosa pseudoharengus]|uniref:serglycin n=1 Tax=Alosa sapidissima TaxID=34773 RepID=UPI001C09BF0E|nr:serglycin [Alosa sapidissima]
MAQFGKLVMLAVLCFIGESVLGAPTKGRYMWLRCRPDSKNPNCMEEKGPMINLDKYPDTPKRLPSSAVQEILPNETGLEPDEQSGDNTEAGKHIPDFLDRGSGDQLLMDSLMQRQEESSGMEEGSSDFDYTNFVLPEKMPYYEEYENNMIQ